MALAIRPNLFAIAGGVLLWAAAVDWRLWRQERRIPTTAARAAAAAAPALAAIVWWNWHVYGALNEVGYGAVEGLYSISHLRTNISQFGQWTLETQPSVFLASALFFAIPRSAVGARIPFPRLLLGSAIAAVFASYAFYVPFDVWWFLRFLLPLWPAMMIAAAMAIHAVVERWPSTATRVGAAIVVAASTAIGVSTATDRYAFDVWRNERRYVDVGRYIADHTDPQSVVLTVQQSGSIRHYGGRLTLRWDILDEAWLDRAVAFLVSIGRHPYIVLDGGEVDAFRKRFTRENSIGALAWRPSAALRTPSVLIYDPLDQNAPTTAIVPSTADDPARWRCDAPAPHR
jgi:hypothetical protein